jgi:hypothetical protein
MEAKMIQHKKIHKQNTAPKQNQENNHMVISINAEEFVFTTLFKNFKITSGLFLCHRKQSNFRYFPVSHEI